MDDIVRQAMRKWPNVPDCYDWLGLDARGNWFMRDARVQALGPFPTLETPGPAAARGALLTHGKLIEFIHRNYACDESGRWFFQNGPQRVYVALEATPFIWRLQISAHGDLTAAAHTGQPAHVRHCLLDAQGHVYLDTDLGFGLVHSQDVPLVADRVERGQWQPEPVEAHTLPTRFGFVRHPRTALTG